MATIPLAAALARPRRRLRYPASYLALLPAAVIVVVAYLGCLLWTSRLSFTRVLPSRRTTWMRHGISSGKRWE